MPEERQTTNVASPSKIWFPSRSWLSRRYELDWVNDGTWRRPCSLKEVSDIGATFAVEGSVQGLNLKEFFLLLSSTGLAYRGDQIAVKFRAELRIQASGRRSAHGRCTAWVASATAPVGWQGNWKWFDRAADDCLQLPAAHASTI